jgi:protein SDA1
MAGGGKSDGGTGGGAGLSTGAGTKVDVTLKLSQLQNLVKRDPKGYREDYEAQIRRLESECGILTISPVGDTGIAGKASKGSSSGGGKLEELIQFAAATSSSSYKGKESNRIAAIIIGLLVGEKPNIEYDENDDEDNTGPKLQKRNNQKKVYENKDLHTMTTMLPSAALQLPRDIRKTCVSALILMRNKGALEPLRVLELFFRLMAVIPDKTLREILYKHMVNDIRNINKKGKRDDKVNRAIQSFLHRVVSTHGQEKKQGEGGDEEAATDIAAKRATDMVCELYRRQVWTDDRTVAILASAAVSKNTTVASRAMRFFLNIEEKMAADTAEREEDEWDASQKINYHSFSRKTKNRTNHVKRQIKNRNREQRKREGADTDDWIDVRDDEGVDAAKKLYPAIELLRDPQGLAEAVLKRLKNPKASIPYKNKLLMMNFVTRLVGNHELLLLNLYPFLQKYMGGQQRDVTGILAYAVQACHESLPPDEVYGILKTIAHNFVTERCSEEQMAVGINAIRAICARTPSVLSIDDSQSAMETTAFDVEAFVRDIAAFANHRDRSVSIAGKSYQNFIRATHPSLLQGKNRGLKGTALHKANARPMRYGELKVNYGVEGADLLLEYEAKKAAWDREQERLEVEGGGDSDIEEDEEIEEAMNDEEPVEDDDEEDEEAPDLIVVDPKESNDEDCKTTDENGDEEDVLDLSKMTQEERNKLKQEISSTRIFTASDFVKMRKLVEREERARRDPREAARRKRAIAQGREFDELSEDDWDSDGDSDDEGVRIKGAVNPDMIMAEAKRKRKSKAERLQKVLAGREKFESNQRAGGSTNTEKERKKNFLMSKSSKRARSKGRGKGGLTPQRGHGGMPAKTQGKTQNFMREARKRRRKT